MSYDAEKAKRRTIANAPTWARRLFDAARADYSSMTEEDFIAAFGIIEALGLEETDEDWAS